MGCPLVTDTIGRVVRKCHAPIALLVLLIVAAPGHAIPPNTPIVNVASTAYSIGGASGVASDSAIVVTDPAAGNSAPISLVLDPASVVENVPGAVVGAVTVIDLDPLDTHTITVSDPRFEVVGGQLVLVAGVGLDFESEPSVSLTFTVTDAAGGVLNTTVVIAVQDVNEPPTAIALDDDRVPADQAGAVVGGLTVTDPDAGDTHVFSVDDARFEVVAGELKLIDGVSLPLGTVVDVLVTATDSGGLGYAQTFSIVVSASGPGSTATLRFFAYAPLSGASRDVQPTACASGTSGPFVPVAPPLAVDGSTLPVPGSLPLLMENLFRTGTGFFVELSDTDANLDAAAIDFVTIELSGAGGDVERLLLAETSVASGVFLGYFSSASAGNSYDCAVTGGRNGRIDARYVDASDPSDIATATARTDPVSRVFVATDGTLLDGAVVSLLDGAGNAATPFGADGNATFPATVATGTTVSDSAGANYAFGSGEYYFPFLARGDYRLDVVVGNRFRFPSAASDAALQALPGAPFALGSASRGDPFVVDPGPVLAADLPVDLLPIVPSAAALTLFAYAPGNGAAISTYVAPTACFDDAVFTPAPAPNFRGVAIAVPGSVPLVESATFAVGEPLFVVLRDPDQDADPFNPDTVLIDVQATTGDVERIELTETGASTGAFVGWIALGGGASNDCALGASAGAQATFAYVDPSDPNDRASASASISPAARAFSSSDGAPVDGAIVTLIDAATGVPAANAVFADDGATAFPVSVVTGASATDAGGNTIDFATGTFRFPVVAPGDYRFEVTPPPAFVFPSQASDVDLSLLPGAPFALGTASHGGVFTVAPGGAVSIDLPFDVAAGDAFLTKLASKDVAAVGDFVQYQVRLSNPSANVPLAAVAIVDRLPRGFRYVPGSARVGAGVAADPVIAGDGRDLSFNIGTVAPGATVEVRYVAEIGSGTPLGRAENRATATGTGIASANVAVAAVMVREELFTSRSLLIGEVRSGACGGVGEGVAGVRLLLEDGTYVVTDADGKYHFEGLQPGTHVVQIDLPSVPATHELVDCMPNARHAGREFSRFVDLAAGTLWREDFRLVERPPQVGVVASELAIDSDGDEAQAVVRIATGNVAVQDVVVTVLLPPGVGYVSGTTRRDDAHVEAEPTGIDMAALSFHIGDLDANASTRIAFAATLEQMGVAAPLKAVTQFRVDGQATRTPVATAMLEPGPIAVDAEPVVVEVTQARRLLVEQPVVIPELPGVETPVFDSRWLAAQDARPAIVWPPENHQPRIPSIGVVVKHPLDQRVALTVDGGAVSSLAYEGVQADPERGIAISRFRGVPLSTGRNVIAATMMDGAVAGEVLTRTVRYSGMPVRAEWVAERSHLVADGITAPILAVRLLDRDGQPVRPGLTGAVALSHPYRLRAADKPLGQTLPASAAMAPSQYLVRDDGIAYLELEPTPTAGRLEATFEFGELRSQQIRARLLPAARDWVMVGFGEGTLGYGTLSGAVEPLADDDVEEDVAVGGRIALYAKGRVRGNALLTVAYDSDNQRDDALLAEIDPDRFYTLYGDGAEQRYDAASQRKLYVRLERDDFFALFGDFETGFEDTELTRYARPLNGAQGAYYGDRVRFEAFTAESDQGSYRDDIHGNGTSGIYRLSRSNVVVNSESLRIEVRDRFRSEVVLSSQPLTRYLDYSIDFDRGTFFTKRPIPSQDPAFNPTYIVAEYEVRSGEDDAVVGGVRAAVALGARDGEAGITVIHDEATGAAADLLGVDLRYAIDQATEARIEGAWSETDALGSGSGYIAELKHQGEDVAGRVYLREQEREFGLGQQVATEAGTRKIGLEGEYLVTEALRLRTDVFAQALLDGSGERRVLQTDVEHTVGGHRLSAGVRAVREQAADGHDLDGNQLVLGASQDSLAGGKLKLHTTAELELERDADNTDYPDRVLAGAEYRLLDGLSVMGEQEFTFGDRRDTNDTRFGLLSRPWSGAEAATTLTRQHGEHGERLFATTGLLQQWQVNERWQLDFGVDRVQTIEEDPSADDGESLSWNPNAPLASGAVADDFDALYAGATYRREQWHVTGRLELHDGDAADKTNLLLGASRQLAEGRVVSFSGAYRADHQAAGVERDQAELRFGFAWRPAESPWSLLSRLDLDVDEQSGGAFYTRTRKLIENMNLNYAPGGRHQLALQLGVKYALEDIDGSDYDGLTTLTGMEYRFDFHPRWDLGMRASALHSFGADTTRYSTGVSIGHDPVTNLWVSLGYNFLGFEDRDFAGADYTAKGPYLKLRFKVDQSSLAEYLEFASIRD